MKKIKLIILCSLFFFCFYGKTSFKADAAINKKVLYDDTLCWLDTFKVLNKGYYIFTTPNEIDPDMFMGDLTFYLKSGNKTLTTDDFLKYLPFDMTYIDQLNELISSITKKVHEDTINHGVALFTVNTSAVFYTGNNTVEHAVCEYLEYNEQPKDTTIAGGMTHIVNVDNRTSLKEIESRYTATDNVDGDITDNLCFETNYKDTSSPIGTYFILAYVFDNENNYSCAIDFIIVKDFIRPMVHLPIKEIEKEVFTNFTSADAKAYFSFSDNNTESDQLKVFFEDNYNNQYDKVGEYYIKAYAIDKDENRSETATFIIKIIDNSSPEISLIENSDKIIADHILSNEEIISLMKVTDNYYTIPNSEIVIIENSCTGQQGKEYYIKVEVMDGSGNKGEKTFAYYLTDTISPIICVKNVLYIEAGKPYSNEQIIAMLKEANLIDITSSITNISTTFLSADDKEEVYELKYEELLDDGTIKRGSLQLKFFHLEEVKQQNLSKKKNYFYLWFLLLLIPIGSIVIWMIRHKKKCAC